MGIESLLQQNVQSSGLAGVDRLARNAMFPQSQMDKTQYATPSQMPTSAETIRSDYDTPTNAYTGLPTQPFARGGIANIPRFADGGGPESEGKIFVGDENSGRWVDPSELNPAPQEPAKPPTMAELADQIKSAYRTNQNYDQLWKQFAAMKESDPQQWYKHELGFLGGQQGWQIGQNTSERNAALEPQLQNTIADAKKAGLSEDEINSILGSSRQEGNLTNQRRIAEEAAKGKGWVNQNIPGGWTTVGAAALAAAAPYLAPELFAGMGAAETGALTTTELMGGAGGAFIPTAGSGASFAIPAGAYTAAGAAGAAGAGAAGSGSWGLTPELAAELGLDYSSSGLSTSGALGSQTLEAMGLNTAGGMTAKQAALAKMGLDLISGGADQAGSGGYAPQTATAVNPASVPKIERRGVTGYYGAAEAPDYRTVGFKPYLSRIRGVPEESTFAVGGITSLGGYSDGGRLLKGPGDGMSDNIPATIADKQPARLADGEFVIPADVVSHLGNGSTDAGAKQLYAMMDKIRKARTGTKKQGKQINPSKFLPKG